MEYHFMMNFVIVESREILDSYESKKISCSAHSSIQLAARSPTQDLHSLPDSHLKVPPTLVQVALNPIIDICVEINAL